MTRLAALAVALFLSVLPAWADRNTDLEVLYEALGLVEVVDIMRQEGVGYGADMEEQMFPGRGGPGWAATVEQIYDREMMSKTVMAALDKGIDDEALGLLLDFFTSERGKQIIGFEVSARRAMMDEDIEEAAEDRMREMRDAGGPRIEAIERFITANDLVESNIMGAMNSNYAFYQGLLDGDAFGGAMTESDILNDVWSQEPEIRSETETWVWSFLAMAYQPLEDDDLEAYISLSETKAGRDLNRALFNGFDRMYVAISRGLGSAAARFMAGQDI
jgi:hypothetical protein